MKELIKRIPILRDVARAIYVGVVLRFKSFPGSTDYWRNRYRGGGNSGEGSYRKLAEFKADVLNRLVADEHIDSVIEYGCGDGNQLTLARYPRYLGFDVSPEAIDRCRKLFATDSSKRFALVDAYRGETAELTLSLDVVYHLVEDGVFAAYMERLFDSATRLVVVYSSNTDEQERVQAPHVRHRLFSTWVEQHRPQWTQKQYIPNAYPYAVNKETGSFADFYVFAKCG